MAATSPTSRTTLLVAGLVLLVTSACGPMYYQQDPGYYGASAGQTQDPTIAYGELGAYGSWSWSSQWGRVWIPYANRTPGWRPYTVGSWVYTDYGWTWNSSEQWGASTYHYGRWGWEAQLGGWVWVPGYVWAPAWVSWRSGGGCVGWAPIGPSGVVYTSQSYWVFVQQQHIHATNVHTVVISSQQVPTIYNQTVIIGDRARIRDGRGGAVAYNAGPAPRVVQTWTGQPVQPRQVATIPSAVPRAAPPARNGASSYQPGPRDTAPGYQPAPRNGSPGYQPAPRTSAPAYQPGPRDTAPGYQPAPRNASPGYQPAPRNASPGYQPAPRNASPGYQPAPRNASPGYQPSPRNSSPGYQPAPRPAPSYQPTPRPAPNYEQPAPRPAPNYQQPAPRPAPSYQPGASAPSANRSAPYAVQPRSNNGGSSRSSSRSSSSSSSSSSSNSRGDSRGGGRASPGPAIRR